MGFLVKAARPSWRAKGMSCEGSGMDARAAKDAGDEKNVMSKKQTKRKLGLCRVFQCAVEADNASCWLKREVRDLLLGKGSGRRRGPGRAVRCLTDRLALGDS